MWKKKWADMTRFRQVCLLLQAAVVLLFTVLYPVAGSQKGTEYRGDFYRRSVQGDATVYTGMRNGLKTVYTVRSAEDGYRVEYEVGGERFGPYDIALLPETAGDVGDWTGPVTGDMEVRQGDRILYRGPYYASLEGKLLWMKDMNAIYIGGKIVQMGTSSTSAHVGEPTAADLLNFAMKPAITHQGNWVYYLAGFFLAVVNLAEIWFAEELFTWSMSWRINRPEEAEPSEWELFRRHAGWIVFFIFSLAFLTGGLTSTV